MPLEAATSEKLGAETRTDSRAEKKKGSSNFVAFVYPSRPTLTLVNKLVSSR